MIDSGSTNKNRKNPNDPARFIGTIAATKDGEAADVHTYLDTDKIKPEAQYDGLYAVCSDLLDDDVKDILKVSEGRWQIKMFPNYENRFFCKASLPAGRKPDQSPFPHLFSFPCFLPVTGKEARR